MIGAPGQNDIMLAYSINNFEKLDDNAKKQLAFAKEAINKFAQSARTVITGIKQGKHNAKKALQRWRLFDQARPAADG